MINLPDRLKNVTFRWSPTAYKFLLASFVAAALGIPILLAALPFVEFLNDMAAQPKGKTQMTYGRLFGERLIVSRPTPEGTIPRSYVRYEFDYLGNTLDEAKLVGQRLANPVPLTVANVERGQARFKSFCFPCHGPRGDANGPATGVNRFPTPPSLHGAARDYADGAIFHIVTAGMGKMPSYATQIEPEDRWRIIYFVRALQRAANPQPGDFERPEPTKE